MEILAVGLSFVALIVSVVTTRRQILLARQGNSVAVLVDLFREHRSERLAKAREFVYSELENHSPEFGFSGLPEDKRSLVRDLAWFYDNLGALVAHNVVDIGPVSGYLGGAVAISWEKVRPFVEAERRQQQYLGHDPRRRQEYFENLYLLVVETPPPTARAREHRWRLKQAYESSGFWQN